MLQLPAVFLLLMNARSSFGSSSFLLHLHVWHYVALTLFLESAHTCPLLDLFHFAFAPLHACASAHATPRRLLLLYFSFHSPRIRNRSQMTSRTHLKRKEVDDVMGGEAAWENVDKVPGMFLLSFAFPLSLFPLYPLSASFLFPLPASMSVISLL